MLDGHFWVLPMGPRPPNEAARHTQHKYIHLPPPLESACNLGRGLDYRVDRRVAHAVRHIAGVLVLLTSLGIPHIQLHGALNNCPKEKPMQLGRTSTLQPKN